MNTIFRLFAASGIVLVLVGCFKDNSTDFRTEQVSILKTNDGFDKAVAEYELNEVLKMSAPAFTQSNGDKPITYTWEINQKVVGNGPELEYQLKDKGDFEGRLTLFNGDSYLFFPFKFKVLNSFTEGLYALAQYKGTTVVSYAPNTLRRPFTLDVLRTFNPDTRFGTEPTAMAFMHYSGGGLLFYVATNNPNKLYRLEGKEMVLINEMSAPRPSVTIDYITMMPGETRILFVEGEHLAQLQRTDIYSANSIYRGWRTNWGQDLRIAKSILAAYTPFNGYENSHVYYAQGKGIIVSPRISDSNDALVLTKEFAGRDLITMHPIQNSQEFVALLKGNNGLELAWFTPGAYASKNKPENAYPPALKDIRVVPVSSLLTEQSSTAASPLSNLFFYSSANKVYAYAVLSQGNFPTSPVFTCDEGDMITAMLISNDYTKLYIATTSGSGDTPGSLYCYSLEGNRELIWKRKNVTGTVKQLAERV